MSKHHGSACTSGVERWSEEWGKRGMRCYVVDRGPCNGERRSEYHGSAWRSGVERSVGQGEKRGGIWGACKRSGEVGKVGEVVEVAGRLSCMRLGNKTR